jgi:putative ABC transport system permease protein
MLRVTVKGLLAHKLRMGLSALAVVLGVAFVAGSLVFTDTLDKTFTGLTRQTAPDVTVRPVQTDAAKAGGVSTGVVTADLVDHVAALPGVARADGLVTDQGTYVIGKNGKVVGGGGAPGLAGNYDDTPAADGAPIVSITQGSPPTGPGQLLLDEKTAAAAGYTLGDTVRLVTSGDQPTVTGTLVGTLRLGSSGTLAGATLVQTDTATAQQWYLRGLDEFQQIAVTGDGSQSNQQLRDAVAAALPPGIEALDDAQVAAENQHQVQDALAFITTFLLLFAAVALVVGSFLILNTFSITVAQRGRELALFRALGATRRQLTRSVLLEALLVGLVGSTVGLLLGVVLALGLTTLIGLIGLDLGGVGLVFGWRTAVAAYAVGVPVTLLAAYLPARLAARVPPVAAMRDDASIPESSLRRRLVGGAVLTIVGAGLMVWALAFGGGLQALGAGVLTVFLGVTLLAPVIGRPIVTAIAGPYRRIFGTVGLLARENTRRNPRRTAATASALMIGLALVTTTAVLGQSTKASVEELIRTDLKADYVVSNTFQSPFSAAIATQIATVPGVETTAPIRFSAATIDGRQDVVAAFDAPDYSRAVTLTLESGTLVTGDDGLLVAGSRATSEGWKVGDTVTVGLPTGARDLPIAGIITASGLVRADIVVPLAALEAGGVPPVDNILYVNRAPGADPAAVTAGIDAVLADLPTVILKDQSAYTAEEGSLYDPLLGIVYALLGLAIIIAVLGIVNTLALSVIERTREVGLLRAVGMSRRQLRSMIRLESVAIAVLGAVLGIGLGLAFGVSLQHALAGQGIPVLSIPGLQLGGFVVLAALAGVLAAVLPARRAARMDVLRAVTTE